MRKLIGLWLVILIMGMTVSTGVSNSYVKAATSGPYEEFWQILNREAELVVQFNSTGNVSLAQELIQNSRLGAENAANISALIWQALEELKSSGVKTYYTAQELQEMAQNISQNGLSNETVQALKAQGWTDTQIQALEEYIVQNAGEINQDFNMTAFLEGFSMAFINVAFKYNEYEAWTLKKWKWTNTQKAPETNSGYIINPTLSEDWVMLYLRYSQSDYQRMESAAKTLRQSMYDLITGVGGSVTLLSYGESASPSQLQGSVDSIIWVENGGLLITVTTKKTTTTEVITEKTTYYWPSALRAYELVGNIYALVKARNYGNDNPVIDSILNQKIAELKEALKVAVASSEVTSTPITNPTPIKPVPIKPGDPVIPDPLPKLPLDSTTTTGTITTGSSDVGGVTLDGVLIDSNVLREALDTQNDPGILTITDVAVIVDKNIPGEVTYHVKASFKAENNAVSNIKINVKDYTTGGSDSGTVSFLNSGESYTWEGTGFTLTHTMAGELIASGKVEITYTPSCGAVPLSGNQGTLSTSPSCQERTVTKEYSATINLKSPVDWSKVGIRVEASRESITEGESVTYRVIVENNNSKALSGVRYSVTVPYSITKSPTYTNMTDIPANGKTILYEQTVTYTDTGTYVVHASIYWNGNSKSAEKSVTVTSGTLTITGVDVSPANPTHGDSVSFDVSLKNPVSRSRTVTVKLFIDGVEKSSKTITIGSGGSGVVTLTWTAQAGEHEWRIEVWESGKLEASRSGSIEVKFPTGSGVLEIKEIQVIPNPPTVKKPVTFRIKVKNLYSVSKEAKISLEIPEMGFKTDLTKVIAPGDYGIFDIQWNPGEVGLFNVITNLFSREDNGDDKLEDEEHTTVRVRDNLFGRLVSNVNNTVTQGTTVHFDVIVENKDDYPVYNVPIRVFYTYQDPNGEFSDPIRVFERNPRQIDGLGVNITWFNMTLTNPGEYYFTLYVNGELEDEKIITVNPEGNVMAWMECEDTIPLYDELSCHVHVLNNSSDDIPTQVTKVMFSGYDVWSGENWEAVTVNYITGTTVKRHSEGIIYIGIDVDGWLSERVYGDEYYIYLFLNSGQPKEHMINVDLRVNNTHHVLGYIITIYPGDDKEGGKTETADYILKSAQVAGGASTVLGFVLAIGGNPIGLIIAGIGFGTLVLTTVGYSTYKGLTAPTPVCSRERDNNLICGG